MSTKPEGRIKKPLFLTKTALERLTQRCLFLVIILSFHFSFVNWAFAGNQNDAKISKKSSTRVKQVDAKVKKEELKQEHLRQVSAKKKAAQLKKQACLAKKEMLKNERTKSINEKKSALKFNKELIAAKKAKQKQECKKK